MTLIFARVRVIRLTNPDTMISILEEDIEDGHSVNDVEKPEENQLHRLWSDEEDLEAITLDDRDEQP